MGFYRSGDLDANQWMINGSGARNGQPAESKGLDVFARAILCNR
jgi:hypothetical protein